MIPPFAVAEHHQRLAESFIGKLGDMTASRVVWRARRLAFSWHTDATSCMRALEQKSEVGRAVYCDSLEATYLDFASLWTSCIEKRSNEPSSASGRCRV